MAVPIIDPQIAKPHMSPMSHHLSSPNARTCSAQPKGDIHTNGEFALALPTALMAKNAAINAPLNPFAPREE
jgi:hypothetical protein